MEWRSIEGYDYPVEVSDDGQCRVFIFEKWRLRKIGVTKLGYARANLLKGGKMLGVRFHRLVAEAFVPRVEGKPHVNHKDGNKLNNTPQNLEWVTLKENMEHAWRIGLMKGGEDGFNAKLTDAQVAEIRALIDTRKHSLAAIGRMYGVSKTTIGTLRLGVRSRNGIKSRVRYGAAVWTPRIRHSDEKIREIRHLKASGLKYNEVAERCGVSRSLVEAVHHGYRANA